MTDVSIGDKTYSVGFTMLGMVRSKALIGKPFFEVVAAENLDAEAAIVKVLTLLLLGLQAKHADEFKTVEDVAAAFTDMAAVTAVTPTINAELQKFLAVDASLQKQLSDAQNAAAKDTKKKSHSTPSPKTPTPQSAESASV